MRNSPITQDESDVIRGELEEIRRRLLRRENDHEPTMPIYEPDFPDDPIDAQIAFNGSLPYYYMSGSWHPFAGFDAIWGQLYNDANIIAGTGFTAEWNDEDMSSPSANLITIRFDSPFADPPTVLLTANNNLPADVTGEYAVSLKTRDSDFIVVEGKEFDGTANIGGFDFAAIATSALS